jgi:hypothetical protein
MWIIILKVTFLMSLYECNWSVTASFVLQYKKDLFSQQPHWWMVHTSCPTGGGGGGWVGGGRGGRPVTTPPFSRSSVVTSSWLRWPFGAWKSVVWVTNLLLCARSGVLWKSLCNSAPAVQKRTRMLDWQHKWEGQTLKYAFLTDLLIIIIIIIILLKI